MSLDSVIKAADVPAHGTLEIEFDPSITVESQNKSYDLKDQADDS